MRTNVSFLRQGQYGGILSAVVKNHVNKKECEPDSLLIYCTRPGCCIWKASVDHGEVLQSLRYKEATSEPLIGDRKLSFTELPAVEQIDVNGTKSYSKNKSVHTVLVVR